MNCAASFVPYGKRAAFAPLAVEAHCAPRWTTYPRSFRRGQTAPVGIENERILAAVCPLFGRSGRTYHQ
jgi:hypothetical protein